MADLSSASTLAEVEASFDDNASYREDESTTKAAKFITACTILLRRKAKKSSDEAGSIERSTAELKQLIADAREFIEERGDTGGAAVNYFDRPGSI